MSEMDRKTSTTGDRTIGGGSVNEEERTFGQVNEAGEQEDDVCRGESGFRATSNRSHLIHAIEGLDRYPNYLARWPTDDTEELEKALENRLRQVREQMETTKTHREDLRQVVDRVCQEHPEWSDLRKPPQTWEEVRTNILDPRAAKAIFKSNFFRANHHLLSVQEMLQKGPAVDLDAGYLEELMDEEVTGVYSFPLLSPEFCSRVQLYLQCIQQKLDPSHDGHWNRLIRDLDNIGLTWLNDLLLQLIVRPIARHLFHETDIAGERGKGELDWRHGFVAAYAATPNHSFPRQLLVPHTDDAEVTLNVCIGADFKGGRLRFRGLRAGDGATGTLDEDEYIPELGRAVIHSGRHFHEVTEVTSGNRLALVLWSRSWSGVRADTCACCWLNRRTGTDRTTCVCGPRWN